MFVWTLEANLLGLWGLAMALAYFTQFHLWVVVSQLAVSIATFCMYYLFVAVDLTHLVPAVAITHMCFMIGLLVTFLMVLFDSNLWTQCFASTVLGAMPVSAAVGLSWIIVVCFSSTAMYLSHMVERRKQMLGAIAGGEGDKQKKIDSTRVLLDTKPLLIFHVLANSTSVYMPLFVTLYLYGSWAAEPSVIVFLLLDVAFAIRSDMVYIYLGTRSVAYALVFVAVATTLNLKQVVVSIVLIAVYAVSVGIYLNGLWFVYEADVAVIESAVVVESTAKERVLPSTNTSMITPNNSNIYSGSGTLNRFMKISRDPESQQKRMF